MYPQTQWTSEHFNLLHLGRMFSHFVIFKYPNMNGYQKRIRGIIKNNIFHNKWYNICLYMQHLENPKLLYGI